MPTVDPSVLASIPPGVDPSDYLAQMRKQRIADYLTQNSLQAPDVQQPAQGVKGLYQAARVSPLAGLSKIAEALMAKRATDDSNKGMAQQYAKSLQAFGQPAPVSQGANPGNGRGAGANDAGQPAPPPAAAAPPQQQQGPPLNPAALPPSLAMRLYMQKPEEYGKLLAGPDAWQMAMRANGGDQTKAMAYVLQTPEYRTKLQEYGGNADALAQATRDAATKTGTIAMRQGEDAMIPNGQGGYSERRNPVLAQGAVVDRDAQGNPIGTRLLPGETAAVGARKVAEENATPHIVPTASGTPTFITPHLGGGGPASASGASQGRQYFPNSASPGSSGGLQTTAGKESLETGAKNGQEYSQGLAKDASGALEVHRSLSEMQNLAKDAPPSALNEHKMSVGAMMMASGAKPDTVSRFLGVDVGALQAAAKQNSTLAVNSIHAMTNRGTNFDLDTFMKNNPNLGMTPGGFSRVVDYMDKKAVSTIDKQSDFQKFKKDVPPDEWEAEHTAHWNQKQMSDIAAGKTNSSKATPLLTKQLGGVTYEQLGPGQWRVKQ